MATIRPVPLRVSAAVAARLPGFGSGGATRVRQVATAATATPPATHSNCGSPVTIEPRLDGDRSWVVATDAGRITIVDPWRSQLVVTGRVATADPSMWVVVLLVL